MKTPKLPLTEQERKMLRTLKVKIGEIHQIKTERLAEILGTTVEHSAYLKALATFQQIPSIGEKFAKKLVEKLSFYHLEELKEKHPGELMDELEIKLGCWTDPCVEDQMRCVVYHANHPGSDKQWYAFTEERKQYRDKFGYPDTRPVKAWYE